MEVTQFYQYINGQIVEIPVYSIIERLRTVEQNYLNKTDAQGLYLSKDDAGTTYLSKTNANETYLSKDDATVLYLSKTDAGNTYLKLTGGTITGIIKSKNSTISIDTIPDANTSIPCMQLVDKDGIQIGTVYHKYLAESGDSVLKLVAMNRKTGETSTLYSTIDLIQKKDGTAYATVPPPSAEAKSNEIAPVIWVRDRLKMEIEAVSGGRNTVVYDDFGYPHIMVVIPRFNLQDIDTSLGTGTHPAFVVNGITKSEILIGKYVASKGSDGRVKTLPHKFPWNNINFDDSLNACKKLGSNFSLCSRATASARALYLWKHFGDHTYLGNTYWGRSHVNPNQTGTMGVTNFNPGDTGNNNNTYGAATATGSGPVEWNDDETPYGVSDYVGNVWEWQGGLRLNNGEIQVIENNNALLQSANMAADSSDWKAILASDGSLVAPGTAGTLKYNSPKAGGTSNVSVGAPTLCTTITYSTGNTAYTYTYFKDMKADTGVNIPAIAKILGLYPMAADTSVQGAFWMRNAGERLPICGGDWNVGSDCGPFALNLGSTRSALHRFIGFRVAFAS